MTRHWVGRVDLLFTSEALNLADLYRLMPTLVRKPSVVYFHSNQLPHPSVKSDNPLNVANLNTAAAAHEIWFNSLYHLRDFFTRASTLVQRHPELSGRNPMPELTAKAQLIAPPVDFTPINEHLLKGGPPRRKRAIFVDTRDAWVDLRRAHCLHDGRARTHSWVQGEVAGCRLRGRDLGGAARDAGPRAR